jgi:pyruvate/2-oxoglutarate dehydrogenase complex dihydrolipoamide acyltransferase (E2) component
MDILVAEALWASSMLPKGILERWVVPDGAAVNAGDRIAEVRIEDALHEIMAPSGGRLTIMVATNGIVEPGSVIGQLDP